MLQTSPFDEAWSPYASGIVIGLLQVPAFLIIETALGASSPLRFWPLLSRYDCHNALIYVA